jgi:maltose alpha-D-glucosyltransferase/alpha-amylase
MPSSSQLANDPLWYKDAVIYEVRARSFFDSNDDGVGDIHGLTQKLDYLTDLGVTAIWLLPHYPSPGKDDGYDIADYQDIDPVVGSLEDFDELIEEAHRRGLRVITELVLNHTSDQHPWFQRARRAPEGSPERDFYVWNQSPDKYRDARIIFRDFEPSNWTWDPLAKSYFWHRFFAHQPDLNYRNPAVHEAMLGVVDFWFERGVDGLRLDAVPYLYEAEGTNCENLPETHAFLKKLRSHIDTKFKNKMLLAEANQWPDDAAAYFGDGDECHMNFHFPIMPRLFMAIHMEDRFPIIDILQQTPELHPNCQWAMFLRNHDELTLETVTDEERDYMYRAYAQESRMRLNLGIRRRLAPLVGNDRRRMQLLNGLLFSMPGTPVIYYGDEIGMGDNVYLGDRNGVRTPMQWSSDRNAGFSRANPQQLILPIIIDPEYHYEALHVEGQQNNTHSLLWWTKRLVAMRKRFQAFGRGSVEFLHPDNSRVLAFVRRYEDETILIVANLARHVQFVELDLSAMKGMIPVELMGRTRFPVIGEHPYMLSLGGYDFYWFSVEPAKVQPDSRAKSREPRVLFTSIEELFFGRDRNRLAEAAVAWLRVRGWLNGSLSHSTLIESARLEAHTDLYGIFVRVEYEEGQPDVFFLPVVLDPNEHPAQSPEVILQIGTRESDGTTTVLSVVDATNRPQIHALAQSIAGSHELRAYGGKVIGAAEPDMRGRIELPAETRVLAATRYGSTIAFGEEAVLKIYTSTEEGSAPEVEVARAVAASGSHDATLIPELLGTMDYRSRRQSTFPVAMLERYVQNEGTAWQHAKRDAGRALDRALATPVESVPPSYHAQPLIELAFEEPPEDQSDIVGVYRESANLLGRRLAELHQLLAHTEDPEFEPHGYLPMDQRSKYQNARNLIGRTMALLRRQLDELDLATRKSAEIFLTSEREIISRFEPFLVTRIDAVQIRIHGELHLGSVLFTGKDFTIEGAGSAHGPRRAERRRRGSAFRDVAGLVRSYHYCAMNAVAALRPEDQARAEPWAFLWQLWASAAFLRGYLEASVTEPYLSKSAETVSVLLEAALLEKALTEAVYYLGHRPEMTFIPLQAILRKLGIQES